VCARERYGVGLGECEYLGAAVIKVGKGYYCCVYFNEKYVDVFCTPAFIHQDALQVIEVAM
jgi:hypothetical protein